MSKLPKYVGYKNPPDHTKFQPGQSGNLKGRPKGSSNVKSSLKAFMQGKVTIIENGKKKKVTKAELIMSKLFVMAMQSNVRPLIKLAELITKYQLEDERKNDLPAEPQPGLVVLPPDMPDDQLMAYAHTMALEQQIEKLKRQIEEMEKRDVELSKAKKPSA